VNDIDPENPGNAARTVGRVPGTVKEPTMLFNEELARERIRVGQPSPQAMRSAAQIRALRRARLDAHVRAARVRRILLNR
jgi:hypothetical protein